MDKRLVIHNEMRRIWGQKACESSHKWLTDNFGVSHVKDLSDRVLDRCIGSLKHIKVVRKSTWDKISNEEDRVRKHKLEVELCELACKEFRDLLNVTYALSSRVFINPLRDDKFILMVVLRRGGCNVAALCGFGACVIGECRESIDMVRRVVALCVRCNRYEMFRLEYFEGEGFKSLTLEGLRSLWSVCNKEVCLGRLEFQQDRKAAKCLGVASI